MSDLWKEDPEAFIILRLQESSDPNAAHKAFQAHLKEDAEREGACSAALRTTEIYRTKLAERDAELARLREALANMVTIANAKSAKIDTLLAALREIAVKTRYGCCKPIYPDSPVCAHNIARAAIAEIEEKP